MRNSRTWMLTGVVLTALLAMGCPAPIETLKKTAAVEEHPSAGPHKGALVEWGEEEYHVEFTVDHDKKQATVYILDESAKKAKPIAAETITLSLKNTTPPATVTLKADPMEGEAKGVSSRFVGTHDALGKEMEFEGAISGKVGDTPYNGNFKEKAHDHDHDHKKK